jgi:pimeloyl-[acyl-carrier protein] methyl ester esterase
MIKLHSKTIGQGPNIVLLHGWGVYSSIWQFVAARLAEEFKVTLVDLPGFGRSQTLSDYSMNNILEHLLLVAPPKAAWIGWSLGGLIATRFALTYSSRVSKLICVASSPKFVKERGWPGMDISVLQEFNQQLQVSYEVTLRRFLLLQFYGMTLNREMIRWFELNLFLCGKPSITTLNAGLTILETEDLRCELANLSCPIFYILGKTDVLVPSRIAIPLSRLGQNIQSVVFPKASHALFLSHEDKFLTEVRRFLHE